MCSEHPAVHSSTIQIDSEGRRRFIRGKNTDRYKVGPGIPDYSYFFMCS